MQRGTRSALSAENALRSLLEALTSPPYAPTQHLEREQALAKQFAEILHFTLSFDELKVRGGVPTPGPCEPAESLGTPDCGVSPPQMTNPAIQNDFSYYRRTISRNRINNLQVRGLCCPPGQGWPPPGVSQGWDGSGGFSHPSDPHHTPPSWTQRAR